MLCFCATKYFKITRIVLVFLAAILSSTSAGSFRQNINLNSRPREPVSSKANITFVALLPRAVFRYTRAYNKALDTAANYINKRSSRFNFTDTFAISTHVVPMDLTASPLTVLETLCDKVLPLNTTAVSYMTNSPVYGTNAATAQYVLQLIGYMGIPVIAWNVDNVGLEQVSLFSILIRL